MLQDNKKIGHERKLWSQGTKFTNVSKKFQIWILPPLDQMYGEKKLQILTQTWPNLTKFGHFLNFEITLRNLHIMTTRIWNMGKKS